MPCKMYGNCSAGILLGVLLSLIHKISDHQKGSPIKLSVKLSCFIWCKSGFKLQQHSKAYCTVEELFLSPLYFCVFGPTVCLLPTYPPSSPEGRRRDTQLCSMGHRRTLLFLDFILLFLLPFSFLMQTAQTFAGGIGQQSEDKFHRQSPKERSFSVG